MATLGTHLATPGTHLATVPTLATVLPGTETPRCSYAMVTREVYFAGFRVA